MPPSIWYCTETTAVLSCAIVLWNNACSSGLWFAGVNVSALDLACGTHDDMGDSLTVYAGASISAPALWSACQSSAAPLVVWTNVSATVSSTTLLVRFQSVRGIGNGIGLGFQATAVVSSVTPPPQVGVRGRGSCSAAWPGVVSN